MDFNVPIAIIGMSCRFAGGIDTPSKLWRACADAKSTWSRIPASRFNLDGMYHPNGAKTGTTNVVGGHFLDEDIALFDAGFFSFSSELASDSDPQFRFQLESTYEAMESAGLTLQGVAGSNTSVFAGCFFRDYYDAQFRDPETLSRSLLMGTGTAMAANRLSHFFDLRGASMTIDTGCSTSLTAFHQACQNLRSRESDMSIVGGANIMINPDNFFFMSSLTLLSPDGKSYAFDSRANGYGRGEGSATVIIKRLDDALRDGDPIRAIIRGSAVNQDGKTETITTPSQEAQEELIRLCYQRAGLSLSETTYVETHGTGTPTGDPIEARAVASVFRDSRTPERPLRIGSVKTNLGHCETASGLAAIMKVALCLEKGLIPPSINFEKANENINLDELNLKVPREVETWPEVNGIRRASINNFGYGGANAHVIMESYQSFTSNQSRISNGVATNNHDNGHDIHTPTSNVNEPNALAGRRNGLHKTHHHLKNGENNSNGFSKGDHEKLKSRVIKLSGKDEQAAVAMASNLKDYLERNEIEDEETFLDDLVYTLGQRRSTLPWTAAHPVESISGLINVLGSGKMKSTRISELPKIGFVFTGQGSQWYAMGRELIEAYPVFKECILEAESYLKDLGSTWSLIDELNKDPESTRVNELAMSTPLTCVVQIGLVRLLRSWGVIPSAVTSHSSGEIAAAYTAGALSLRAAMGVAYARGQLAGRKDAFSRDGGMVAVGLGAGDAQKYISRVTSGQAMIACYNSPTSVTVSGDVPAVEELESLLITDSIFARRLKINAAYHSHHMETLAAPYLTWLENLIKPDGHLNEGIIYSSPTTGKRETSGKLISSPQHWVTSLTEPVQFVESFRNMCFETPSSTTPSVDVVIEIGPHAALSGPVREIIALPEFKNCKISYFPTLIRKKNSVDAIQTLACDLIRSGCPVDMKSINFPFGKNGLSVIHDLPTYPWNHNNRHWSEPRINRTYRHRTEGPHDLLGSLVLGTNMITPSWRHVIRLTDLPWLRDHVVQSQILFPGAGYICMAIEAMNQIAKADDKRVLGYQLRDIDFALGLVVPDTGEGVEVQITIRPCGDKAIYAKGWKEFQVFSATIENRWIEHCKGLIHVETATPGDDDAKWSPPTSASTQLADQANVAGYKKYINPQDVYQSLHSVGIRHGPIFQNMKSTQAQNNKSLTSFVIADVVATMPSRYQHDHVLHPTTLDSLFQAAGAAYFAMPGIGTELSTPLVPRSIKKLYVAHNIPNSVGHNFKAYCHMNKASRQSSNADIVVTNGEGDENCDPLLKMGNYTTQSLGNIVPQQTDPYEEEKLATIKWAPDLSLNNSEYFKTQLRSAMETSEVETMLDLKRLSIYFINTALAGLTPADIQQLEGHRKKFYVWMETQSELVKQNKLDSNSSEWFQDSAEVQAELVRKAAVTSVNGEMVCRLGPQIPSILRGEVNPLELMLEDKLLHKYYLEALKWGRSSQKVGELVKHFAHKNPRAKILEIGAGTGGTTTYVLNALGDDKSGLGPLAASYDFTDISSGFFEAAKEKFIDWESLVRYKKLDIEQDPATQGFEVKTYDLIVACQVLHATKNMEHTMANVRKLLKPGGKLILMETTQDPIDLFFVFGLLPGWWLSEEEERKHSPSLSIDMWNHVLKKTGFGGIETEIHDCESEEFYSFSVIMSTAISSTSPTYDDEVCVITSTSNLPESWLDQFRDSVSKATEAKTSVESLDTINGDGKVCIFLDPLDQSILRSPSPAQFEAIKNLCTRCKGLIWVTRGGAMDCENPAASLSQGFLRTLRVEYAGKRMVALDLDPKYDIWSVGSISALTIIFRKVFDYSKENIVTDFELAYRDGVIQVPRYYRDFARNKVTFPETAAQASVAVEPFYQADRPLRLTIGTPGLLDTLAFSDDPDAEMDLPHDFLEIEPKAFGLNFRDIMVAMGQLDSHYMGFECSGLIKNLGPTAAAQGFKIGDRVTTVMKGYYGNLVRVKWTNAVHIPEDMTFEIAASLPVSYATAYFSLFELGRIRKGDKVLIHAATGALGQAAIILAKYAGAEIIVTVGTKDKREFVTKQYGIQPDHIFSSRDTSFGPGILALTQGKGVDIVLNTLAGPLLQESFNCVAPFGRFVEIGKRDLELNSYLEMGTFTRCVSFSSIDLLVFSENRGDDISRALKEIIVLFKKGVIAPVEPVTVYPISKLERTFRLMQAGKHMGKIVISVNADDLVPVLPRKPFAKLRSDVSYLIVGGLGGIGRSVCQWMVDHGARNLIIMSRSANAHEKSHKFMKEMEEIGCRVMAIGCDISNESELASALDTCAKSMPPISGVIQGAMVLQDSILEQMTVDQYNAAIRPKVHGSWNLHNLLKKNLDFFLMLSSLSGVIGLASQSNYAAGGSFQDALARHRAVNGFHGASIDIGVVKSVGYVAENRATAERLRKTGFKALAENDVLSAIESAIISSPQKQMLLGLNGAKWDALGMAKDERFSPLKPRETNLNVATSANKGAAGELSELIAAASSLEAAVQVVVKGITNKLMDMFTISEAEIDHSKSLASYGVDSLVAVELRNMLALRAGAEVSLFDILQSPSITALATTVASKSTYLDPGLMAS